VQKKRKAVTLYHPDTSSCLLPQGLQLPEIPDAYVHFIIQTLILQIPDKDMMGLAKI